MLRFISSSALALLFFFSTLDAVSTRQKRMVKDLDALLNTIEVNYALNDWKETNRPFSFEQSFEEAKQKVIQNEEMTGKEFQELIASLCNAIGDYHVDISFYSTESASLPFEIKGAEGRYFISWVDEELCSFNIGDEVLDFDHTPIDQAVQNLKQRLGYSNHPATDQRFAEFYLTYRSAASGHPVPTGATSCTIKPKDGPVTTCVTEWQYNPEMICHQQAPFKIFKASPRREWQLPAAKKMRAHPSAFIGEIQGYIPELSGKILWKSWDWSPFGGRIYEVEGRPIGFLRIHSYGTDDSQCVEEFRQLIAHLEEHSEALVIDQTGNPGGNPMYLFALLSMLTDEPLVVPTEQILLNKRLAAEALDTVTCFNEDPGSGIPGFNRDLRYYPHRFQAMESLISYHRSLIQEWNAGQLVSAPIPFFGFETLQPHPGARYTKPIIVLVDELDFSCADLFPAILQDNRRALIFGARTAGAGGSTLIHEYPNHFGVESISLTRSLFYRSSGEVLENAGVNPDIPYQVTAKDLQTQYRPYRKALLKAIRDLLKD